MTRNEDGVFVNLSQLNRVAKKDEKQGEQKPADKVEPKFKVGDKIVEDNEFGMVGGEITDIDDTHYELDGGGRYIPISHQDNYKLVEEQKPAWSEEDETMITNLSVIVHTYFSEISGIPFKYDLSEDEIRTWLKSIKDRVQPQTTWKPSDEQIDALESAIADAISSIQMNMLNLLYQDLKKLKGE